MSDQTNQTPTDQLPPRPGPQPYRRLYRRTDDKVIAGVASGLGDYFNIDPVLFRVGFIVLAFVGGGGILLYLLAWLLMPPMESVGGPDGAGVRPRPSRSGRSHERRWLVWVAVGLVVFGVLSAFGAIGSHHDLFITRWWPAGIFWGAVLVGLGVFLYDRETKADREGPAPIGSPPASSSTASAVAVTQTDTIPGGVPATGPFPAAPPSTATAPARVAAPSPPPRARHRATLAWATFGLALLAVGVAALLANAGAITISIGQYLALALTVLGLGLIVGAWWGHARWLILPATLLVPFVLAGSLVTVPFEGGTGQRFYRPATTADITTPYRLAAGQVTLDLRQVQFVSPESITMSVVTGRIVVIVPSNLAVDVHGQVGAGELSLFGQTYDGLKVDVVRTFDARTGSTSSVPVQSGSVSLDLAASFGQIEVDRTPPDAFVGP